MGKPLYYELYDPETNRFLTFSFDGIDLDVGIEEEGHCKGNVIIDPEEVVELINFLLDIYIEPTDTGYQRRPSFGRD